MRRDPSFYELLDNYYKGLLSSEQVKDLHAQMQADNNFKDDADSYLQLIGAIKKYGDRKKVRQTLEQAHNEFAADELTMKPVKAMTVTKYWRWSAIAASVAVIISATTFLVTQSIQSEKTADYKELRRDVQQIQKSQKQIIADLAETKPVPIKPGKFAGTCFLISSNGYLVTSYHVIREADSIIIENKTYGRLRASVQHTDSKNDLAILKVDGNQSKFQKSLPFRVSNREADLGEYAYTLGFPREDIVFGEGSVSASTGFRENPNAYQVSVPVNPGNSGGPLLNSSGDVIGVVSGVQTETTGTSFAIKSTTLLDLIASPSLDTLSQRVVLPKNNAIRSLGRVQQVKKWKDYVFIVRVYKEK